jgi:hypothetical protein
MTVDDCLVEFFDVEKERASGIVSTFRAKAERQLSDRRKSDDDLIYHSEPIHIASDLIGREPKRDSVFYKKYQSIQKRNLKLARTKTHMLEYSLGDATFQVRAPLPLKEKKSLVETKIGKKEASRLKHAPPARLLNTR